MTKIHHKKYTDVLPDHSEWPVTILSENKEEFIAKVVEESVLKLTENKEASSLLGTLEKAVFREIERVRYEPWLVDPSDDEKFWKRIKKQMNSFTSQSEEKAVEGYTKLINDIVFRYANEIFTGFNKSKYDLAKGIVRFAMGRFLTAVRAKDFFGLFTSSKNKEDKIKIIGNIEHIRNLVKKGTVILLPTHFSNLDSVLIGWFLGQIGLPPFIYGAGLNLFNYKFFGFFMRSLGAYKVDRRKKNSIYLSTLITYSTMAIEMGCHSVFFPGGTRCRSGKIESNLKLGLLSSIVQAQRMHYEKRKGNEEVTKTFIVPLSLNYNSVLESPKLIRDHLKKEGKERFYDTNKKGSIPYKIRTFLYKFFTKETDISVIIGEPIDFFGNKIDLEGNSIDKLGRKIDVLEYFIKDDKIVKDNQRDKEYTKILGNIVAKTFQGISQIFSSHLVAFIAFKMMKEKYPDDSIYEFFRYPVEEMKIDATHFQQRVEIARLFLLEKEKNKELITGNTMKKNVDAVINAGIDNVGMYHAKRPLLLSKDKKYIYSKDLMTLYYYHNRLDALGYEELDK